VKAGWRALLGVAAVIAAGAALAGTVNDNRLKQFDGLPSLGRGYDFHKNVLHSVCFEKVTASEPVFDFARLAGGHGVEPGVPSLLLVLGMGHGEPALIQNHRVSAAGHLMPALIEVFQPAIGGSGPDDLGHGVRQVPQAPLAFPQRRLLPPQGLRIFLLGDIHVHTQHSRWPTRPVVQRLALRENPSRL